VFAEAGQTSNGMLLFMAIWFGGLGLVADRYRRNRKGVLDRTIEARAQLRSYSGVGTPHWDPDDDRKSQKATAVAVTIFSAILSVACLVMAISRP
jgi:thiosulfate reductase cytochrome b subunit